MNTIASETLDKLAADPTAFGSIGPRSFAKLVELARLQVALNECEALLPEGEHVCLDCEPGGGAVAWVTTDDATWGDVSDQLNFVAESPAAALLALRDALAALNAKLTP
jgi:hypothetical protein